MNGGQAQLAFANATTEAVKRYNDLKLKLTFKILSAQSAEVPDITIIGQVFADPNTLGQSAGFPVNGNPANEIKLSVNLRNANGSYLATIIAHEIGHTIGMRHTDYMNRSFSQCNPYPKETVDEIARLYPGRNLQNEEDLNFIINDLNPNNQEVSPGAVWIPGTPAVADPNSWMLACIGQNQNRLFTANDIRALRALFL